MSKTLGINVKDEKTKDELFGMLRILPGETDAEKLEFCLKQATQFARLGGTPYESMVDMVRTSQARTLDLMIGTIDAANIVHENALSEKEQEIKTLQEQVHQLQQENKESCELLEQAKIAAESQATKIVFLEQELKNKDALISSLQENSELQKSQENQNGVILARLEEFLSNIQEGQQLSFASVSKPEEK